VNFVFPEKERRTIVFRPFDVKLFQQKRKVLFAPSLTFVCVQLSVKRRGLARQGKGLSLGWKQTRVLGYN